jgi:hypothetical protein
MFAKKTRNYGIAVLGPQFGPFDMLRACPERSEWGRLCGFSTKSKR